MVVVVAVEEPVASRPAAAVVPGLEVGLVGAAALGERLEEVEMVALVSVRAWAEIALRSSHGGMVLTAEDSDTVTGLSQARALVRTVQGAVD